MSGGSTDAPAWTPSALELERRAYRRSRARRSTAVAVVSTVVLTTAAALLVTSAPGWPRTQDFFFDPVTARDVLPDVLRGLWLNLRVLVVAAAATLVLGLALALARTLRGPVLAPVRLLATAYVDGFRGVPLIILIYLVGFGVPALRLQGVTTSAVVLGGLAIVLTYSAYVAEVFRAGIEGVHPSQRAAARSLGLSYAQAMRLVVVPQALRRVQPALLNDFVAMQKDVGLISLLGITDAVRAAQIESLRIFDFTPFVVAGLLFVALSVPTGRFADAVARRAAAKEQAGGVL